MSRPLRIEFEGGAARENKTRTRRIRGSRFLPGADFSLDVVVHLRYISLMKTATIPSVRVEPEFRAEVESVLAEGESLSQFVEASVRTCVERRRVQADFIARGLRSRDEAKRTGDYVEADDVIAGLQRKLDAARVRTPQGLKTRK